MPNGHSGLSSIIRSAIPRQLKAADVVRFLEHVGSTEKNPVDALNQAHETLSFLYREILGLELGPIALPQPPRLLDRLRMSCASTIIAPHRNLLPDWTERFIRFHGLRHPKDMGAAEAAPSSPIWRSMAMSASAPRTRPSMRSCFCTATCWTWSWAAGCGAGAEAEGLANRAGARKRSGKCWPWWKGRRGPLPLMARLLYGCGLRLMECCRLRVQDIDLARGQIMVRQGKGAKDRVVMLPKAVRGDLQRQLEWRRLLHERDLARRGAG